MFLTLDLNRQALSQDWYRHWKDLEVIMRPFQLLWEEAQKATVNVKSVCQAKSFCSM